MALQPSQPDGKTFTAAVLTVAAVYIYFLIFAQFGFLQAVRDAFGGTGEQVRPLMATMGLAGIVGSILAARGATNAGARRWLLGGFGCCALAAACSLGARGSEGFFTAAVFTGLGTGVTTVTLAGILRPAVGGKKLGMVIGWGTGLAYGICNLPGVFAAEARAQAILALGTTMLGAIAGLMLLGRSAPESAPDGEYSRIEVVRWIAIFLLLVSVDSALFYFIQHQDALRAAMWSGPTEGFLNAGAHLVAAIAAGWALDRRGLGMVVVIGAVAIVGPALWFATGHPGNVCVGLAYMAGVSVYSTALVFYPARSGRPALAAWIYAIAGWTGSALGIGLAESRGRLSPVVVAGAGILLAICFAWRYFASRHRRTMNENS
jgi:hypothetical protein